MQPTHFCIAFISVNNRVPNISNNWSIIYRRAPSSSVTTTHQFLLLEHGAPCSEQASRSRTAQHSSRPTNSSAQYSPALSTAFAARRRSVYRAPSRAGRMRSGPLAVGVYVVNRWLWIMRTDEGGDWVWTHLQGFDVDWSRAGIMCKDIEDPTTVHSYSANEISVLASSLFCDYIAKPRKPRETRREQTTHRFLPTTNTFVTSNPRNAKPASCTSFIAFAICTT